MSRSLSFLMLIMLVPLLDCGSQHDVQEKYFLVSANIKVPYWQEAAAGLNFQDAAPSTKEHRLAMRMCSMALIAIQLGNEGHEGRSIKR